MSDLSAGVWWEARAAVVLRRVLSGVRGVWVGCALVLVLVWGMYAWILWRDAAEHRRQQETEVTLEAKGLAEHVAVHLLLLDRLLLRCGERFQATGALPSHAELLAELGASASLLTSMQVTDESGNVVASTPPPVWPGQFADQPAFLALKANPADRLHANPSRVSASGFVSVTLLRPLLDRAGAFQGAVAATIDPLFLRQFVDDLDTLDADGLVNVIGRNDGIVRIQLQGNAFSSGQSVLASEAWKSVSSHVSGRLVVGASVFDARPRLIAFHQAGPYPLAITVSVPTRGFWKAAQDHLLSLTLAIGFSAAVIMLARARTRLEQEQEQYIQRLGASRRRELEANRMKSQFLASVSHELRTPLNSILGFSELIRDDVSGAQTARYAGLIHSSGQHLHSLVNTLLDLAKIEAGRMDVELGEVDLRELLASVSEMHRVAAQKKRLALTLTIAPAGRLVVQSDRTKLLEVLNNVLHNAIKFTQSGSISVTLDADPGGFLIRVVDSGAGIAPADLAHVFEHFNTLPAGASEEKGSGLGLALSRHLVQLLGGSITIASQVGTGTQVEIRLPVAAPGVAGGVAEA